jgi:ABC-2 type transport system permease protein
MKHWVAFWNIVLKDMRTYYLKPPNLSWGIIFPVAWTGMFFIRSQTPVDIRMILPGVMAMSILFGTTSMLAVTVTFERKGRSFERLLLSPVPLSLLMLAKTGGAIFFGIVNALVPLLIASFLTDISGIGWASLAGSVALIAVSSTFLGLFVAVSVSEVFEAQTFSNFFRFPMVFLCGLFFPVTSLPVAIQPLSYILPLTYGADIMQQAVNGAGRLPVWLNFLLLGAFCMVLFLISLRNIKSRWIY